HAGTHLPVHVDLEAASTPRGGRQEGSGAIEDPPVGDEVQTFKGPVVPHLTLELLKGPGAFLRRLTQALGRSAPKGGGCGVVVFGGHGEASPAGPSDFCSAARATCAPASSSHLGV